jgi:uncharacterized Tic20 family protein
MADFNEIIKKFADRSHYAGGVDEAPAEADKKRKSLADALNVRKSECMLRFRITVAILLLIIIVLVYLGVFQPQGLETFKKLAGVLGGGSVIAILTYVLSVRDEVTKIKQTLTLVAVVDDATLNTMLITMAGTH